MMASRFLKIISPLFLILSLQVNISIANEKKEVSKGQPIAVIELFTSQGCSSCPPADRILTGIVEEAQTKGLQVFPLSFHVSYWNYLGWKDPYSNAQFSTRQRLYARAIGSGVYTPQMVFNGQYECVGSRKPQVNKLLRKVLEKETTVQIDLTSDLDKEDDLVHVNFKVKGNTSGKVVQIAVVERMITTQVKRGENGGRTLHHDNVVRVFKTIALKKEKTTGQTIIDLPKDLRVSNTSIIAYIQDIKTMHILGAIKNSL